MLLPPLTERMTPLISLIPSVALWVAVLIPILQMRGRALERLSKVLQVSQPVNRGATLSWTCSNSATWDLVRNAESQAPWQTSESESAFYQDPSYLFYTTLIFKCSNASPSTGCCE